MLQRTVVKPTHFISPLSDRSARDGAIDALTFSVLAALFAVGLTLLR